MVISEGGIVGDFYIDCFLFCLLLLNFFSSVIFFIMCIIKNEMGGKEMAVILDKGTTEVQLDRVSQYA